MKTVVYHCCMLKIFLEEWNFFDANAIELIKNSFHGAENSRDYLSKVSWVWLRQPSRLILLYVFSQKDKKAYFQFFSEKVSMKELEEIFKFLRLFFLLLI